MTNSSSIFSIAVIALAGCSTVPEEVELYNNTPATIAVKGCGADEVVDPGVAAAIPPLCRGPVQIEAGERSWRYKTLWRAWSNQSMLENGEKAAGGLYQLKLQLQPDGLIVVIPRGTDYPVDGNARQPRDFPIRPD